MRGSLGRALCGTHREDLPGCKAVSEARVLVINTGGTIGMVQDDKGEGRRGRGAGRAGLRRWGAAFCGRRGRRPLCAPTTSRAFSRHQNGVLFPQIPRPCRWERILLSSGPWAGGGRAEDNVFPGAPLLSLHARALKTKPASFYGSRCAFLSPKRITPGSVARRVMSGWGCGGNGSSSVSMKVHFSSFFTW